MYWCSQPSKSHVLIHNITYTDTSKYITSDVNALEFDEVVLKIVGERKRFGLWAEHFNIIQAKIYEKLTINNVIQFRNNLVSSTGSDS